MDTLFAIPSEGIPCVNRHGAGDLPARAVSPGKGTVYRFIAWYNSTMLYSGIEIVPNAFMAGMKKAIKSGNRLCVSPAVHSLLMSEQGEKLEALLRSLEFIDLGPSPSFQPMLTSPYSPLEDLRKF